MPIFKLQGPDGREYEVDAPDQAQAVAAFKRTIGIQEPAPASQEPAQPVSQRGTALDPLIGQGLFMGFGDEIKSGVRAGAQKLMGAEEPLGELYDRELGSTRADLEGFRERNPKTAVAAEIGGALMSAPFLPGAAVARGAGLGTRIAAGSKAGAGYGAAYGFGSGEGIEDRAIGSITGAGLGAATGLAAPLAVRGAQAIGRGVRDGTARLAAPVRGAINPEREATRRVGIAAQADNAMPQPRLTPADEAAALARGQPVLNIDRGGETTRALARSSANQSPQGRAALEQAVGDRFTAQGDRTMDAVRQIVGGATTFQNRKLIEMSARAANRPAYTRAFNAPRAAGMWDEGLEQLASAPIVQDAIRQATVTGRNAGALAGATPKRSPFRVDPQSGRLSLVADAKGNRTLPTLEFWDAVKRNLDEVGTREAKQFSRVLRDHLDEQVPEYRTARAGAAKFFGAGDALEAGETFLNSRMANEEARAAFAKMNGAEKSLFAEGFADTLTRRIAESGDRRNVINSLFISSKASRERIEIALGPQKAKELEAFLRVEDLMDRARTAVTGNSTTARQLVELGIGATGGAGVGLYTGDWTSGGAIIAAALTRHGAQRINSKVAEQIGKMLSSPDQKIVRNGLKMVSSHDNWMSALRAADLPTAAAASNAGNQVIGTRRPLEVTVPPAGWIPRLTATR